MITKYSDVFETDGNSGLVTQATASQTKSNIKRLTKTFVTLSLEDVSMVIKLMFLLSFTFNLFIKVHIQYHDFIYNIL